jgi:alkylation response protein AidB-like acyl-CoA dehydrogenase
VKQLIWNDLKPYVETIERTDHIPAEVIDKLKPLGLWGCLVPAEYGGLGLSVSQYIPVLVELSRLHAGMRGLLHAHVSSSAMLQYATKEQQRQLYPGVARGEIQLAFALTEPDAGTGVDIRTHARREGDHYVVNGRKHLISNCDIADYIMLVCYTDPSRRGSGMSVLMLPTDAPGFSWEPYPPLMGCKGGEHGLLTFTDCIVPAQNVLGGLEGRGFEHAMGMLEESRLFIASTSLGTAERAFELSLAYADKRVTFGKPIGERESVRAYLADMAMDIYALRSMLADAVRKLEEGKPIPAEAAMCKLFGAEAVCRVTEKALLVHGGVGYTRMHQVEQLHRDARINLLEEGTPTIQRTVIARTFQGGYRFEPYSWGAL